MHNNNESQKRMTVGRPSKCIFSTLLGYGVFLFYETYPLVYSSKLHFISPQYWYTIHFHKHCSTALEFEISHCEETHKPKKETQHGVCQHPPQSQSKAKGQLTPAARCEMALRTHTRVHLHRISDVLALEHFRWKLRRSERCRSVVAA